jgi:hypothetical protein
MMGASPDTFSEESLALFFQPQKDMSQEIAAIAWRSETRRWESAMEEGGRKAR